MKWFPTMRWQVPDTQPDARHWRGARWEGWEMVWNAVAAERCPRCAALAQTPVRYIHEDEHERVDDALRYIRDALERILDELGIPYRSADEEGDDDGAILPRADDAIIVGDNGLGTGTEQRV